MDELVDNGMILEADPAVLVSRVALRTDDIPLGEQTVAQVRTFYLEQCCGSGSVGSVMFLDLLDLDPLVIKQK